MTNEKIRKEFDKVCEKYSLDFEDIDDCGNFLNDLTAVVANERKRIADMVQNYFNGKNKLRLTTNSVIVVNDIIRLLQHDQTTSN